MSEYEYEEYEAQNEREDEAQRRREREDETAPILAAPIADAVDGWLSSQNRRAA